MSRPSPSAAVAALLMVGTAPRVGAQLSADTAARVDQVFAAYNRTDSPGCAVGVNRDGRRVYRKGFGMANLEFGVPWSEHTVSESGSVAKQFAAGVVAYLAVTGRLDLDDPVAKHVPELAHLGEGVTVRTILHHTSGIRDMWALFSLAGAPIGSRHITTEQALRIVYRQQELNFPPNSQFLYSNGGYLIAGEIVRRVTGQPFAQVSRDTFFRPLGMAHTEWRDDWNRVVRNRATAYSPGKDGYRVDMPYMDVHGAGGLLTTVGDLLVWNEHLDNPTIGGRPWVEMLERRGRLGNGREIDYALGLFVTSHRGHREVSHSGGTGGYRTHLARWPDRKLSIALLCNVGSANPERLARQVADIFLGGTREDRVASASTARTGPIDPSPYVGRYRVPATEDLVTVTVGDSGLVANLGLPVLLKPRGPDRFETTILSNEVVFERGPDGKAKRVTLAFGADPATYERIELPDPTPAELAAFAGSYYSAELDATYQVRAAGGRLAVRVGDQPEMSLARTATLSFGEPGQMSIRFSRARNGQVDGFLLFAGRVRNLRFTRR